MTNLIDDLIQFQKKLDEKTVAEYTDDLYEAMRQLILNEVKLLDKEEVKKFIVENLCLNKNVEFNLGVTYPDVESDEFEEEYGREAPASTEATHKKNTLMDKIYEEFDKAYIPTGSILLSIAHYYCDFSDNSFKGLNSEQFIKALQTELELDCIPITFNLKEHCDMSYRSSYYPFLCFHIDKINIDSGASAQCNPFLQKLAEYKEKLEQQKLAKYKEKMPKTHQQISPTKQELKAEFAAWVIAHKKNMYRTIKDALINSKIRGLDDYECNVSHHCFSDGLEKLRTLSESEFKSNEPIVQKALGVENIEITLQWSNINFKFTPSKLVLVDEAAIEALTITETDMEEELQDIEKQKTEIRSDILTWVEGSPTGLSKGQISSSRGTGSKNEIIKLCFHYLKYRKWCKETKAWATEFISTEMLTIKKYCPFFKRDNTHCIEVARYQGIVNQELNDQINNMLGVTGFEFKAKYDLCDCGLPWGIDRESNKIYNIKHDPKCKYEVNFNYRGGDDDFALFIVLPKYI